MEDFGGKKTGIYNENPLELEYETPKCIPKTLKISSVSSILRICLDLIWFSNWIPKVFRQAVACPQFFLTHRLRWMRKTSKNTRSSRKRCKRSRPTASHSTSCELQRHPGSQRLFRFDLISTWLERSLTSWIFLIHLIIWVCSLYLLPHLQSRDVRCLTVHSDHPVGVLESAWGAGGAWWVWPLLLVSQVESVMNEWWVRWCNLKHGIIIIYHNIS